MTHTTARLLIIPAFLIAFFSMLGGSANAYFTTGQDAEPLGGKALLFTIDYRFGVEKYDLLMPVLGERGSAMNRKAVSYQVFDENGEPAGGTAVGIVFSSAKLEENGMYRIEKGTAKEMTLMVLYVPPASASSDAKYRLQVTQLPFSFDGAQELQLNPSELRYYTTELTSVR